MIAYVLVNASPQLEHSVYNTLIKIDKISEVHPLFGEYDIIIKIEADDTDTISNIIISQIRTIEGVLATKTLTGFIK